MIKHSFHRRASEMEDMDDFSLKGEELNRTLRFLAFINQFLGGHHIILDGLKKVFFKYNWIRPQKSLNVLDLGCGGGDTLQHVAKWAENQNLDLKIYGIDANPNILAFARQNSAHFPEINYLKANFFDKDFDWEAYHIILCSLILHHFETNQLLALLQSIPSGKIVIINDLQRHRLAFYLFNLFCWLSKAPSMARKDGAISIRKGFRKKELKELMARSNIKQYDLRWRWAFRYQLILVK